jgi:hypothetical protein
LAIAGGAAAGGLTVEDILKMVKMNVREEIILSTIAASKARFQLTPEKILELIKAGVPAKVLEVMAPKERAGEAASPLPVRDVRASNAELTGFGYLDIQGQRWCIVTGDAELAEPTTGQPMGETLFGSRDDAICNALFLAARRGLRVDLTGIPQRSVTERVFVGSLRRIYSIGYVWVRMPRKGG